ncbi:MAG: cobalamin biosynthesis protein CbiD [Lachnospiraceae bacterium]|nr:cobalamin biosynthesis protein CbiD [Lachnospiraceae bacterium]
MRYGFTTGSCAAAAAKAAAYMLFSGREKREIEIDTPKGIVYRASIEEIRRGPREVSCGVRKDGGDDPDVTTGSLVCARVCVEDAVHDGAYAQEEGSDGAAEKQTQGDVTIQIVGGAGVGRVTKPGLDQPVGNAAINHVPREMIEKEVRRVCALFDFAGRLTVEISVPGGEQVAEQTFNPRLGIVGGISILGTTGIVEPMSRQALLDTIRVELQMKRAQGYRTAYISPGNYGLEFMKQAYGYDLDQSVKCSNFIGDTLDMAVELGYEKVLLTGHIGKLVKVAGGMMNTHSSEGDCRMELMAAAAAREGADTAVLCQILDCISTEEAIRILAVSHMQQAVMDRLLERILFYLRRRVQGKLQVECILYANAFGELARSEGAADLVREAEG